MAGRQIRSRVCRTGNAGFGAGVGGRVGLTSQSEVTLTSRARTDLSWQLQAEKLGFLGVGLLGILAQYPGRHIGVSSLLQMADDQDRDRILPTLTDLVRRGLVDAVRLGERAPSSTSG